MLETILVILYSVCALSAKLLIIKKKKFGFCVGITASVLQMIHVLVNIHMVGILIMAFGFLAINIYGLVSDHWSEEAWLWENNYGND